MHPAQVLFRAENKGFSDTTEYLYSKTGRVIRPFSPFVVYCEHDKHFDFISLEDGVPKAYTFSRLETAQRQIDLRKEKPRIAGFDNVMSALSNYAAPVSRI